MNKVREVRHRKGMALQEIAMKEKVSPGTLTMIERYGYCPGSDMCRRIADVLEMAEEELFDAEGKREYGN